MGKGLKESENISYWKLEEREFLLCGHRKLPATPVGCSKVEDRECT